MLDWLFGTQSGSQQASRGVPHQTEQALPEFEQLIYRTEDGADYYYFKPIMTPDGCIDIDIISQPSYAGRDESLHTTHRYTSPRGGHRICLTDEARKKVKTIEDAKRYCAGFAEGTSHYIKTGETF